MNIAHTDKYNSNLWVQSYTRIMSYNFLKIRVPEKEKAAFDKKCRENGTDMSKVIRKYIKYYLGKKK